MHLLSVCTVVLSSLCVSDCFLTKPHKFLRLCVLFHFSSHVLNAAKSTQCTVQPCSFIVLKIDLNYPCLLFGSLTLSHCVSFSTDWFHTSPYCSPLWEYERSSAAAEQRSQCKLYTQGQQCQEMRPEWKKIPQTTMWPWLWRQMQPTNVLFIPLASPRMASRPCT